MKSWRKSIGLADLNADDLVSNENHVDVWIASVDRLASVAAYWEFLGNDDTALLSQLTTSSGREISGAARILSRIGLSYASGWRIEPRAWRIRSSPNGKPAVADDQPNVNFSVAHTNLVVVVAISKAYQIGVDVETVEQIIPRDVIAAFCCHDEQVALNKLSAQCMAREFVRLWTLKEAYAKLIGAGHSVDFSSLKFSIDSLQLLQDESGDLPERLTHFETMWVVNRGTLNHVSLAIGLPVSYRGRAVLQVMTLDDRNESNSVLQMPNISL